MRWKYAAELSEPTQPDVPVGSVYDCTTAPDVGDSSSRKSSTVPVAPSAAVPVPKRSAITFPGVGGTFVCGAEHGSALVDGVTVGVSVGSGVWLDDDVLLRVGVDVVVDVVVNDTERDTDGVPDAVAVLVTVDSGVAPDERDADGVCVEVGVVDAEAVTDEELVADRVAVADDVGDGAAGAIASERYSVLLHACAMAERAPLTVL